MVMLASLGPSLYGYDSSSKDFESAFSLICVEYPGFDDLIVMDRWNDFLSTLAVVRAALLAYA